MGAFLSDASLRVNVMETTSIRHVAAFDFDGTITCKDTFIDFARFSLPVTRFWKGVVFFSPLLLLVVLKLISGGWVKERLFSFYFRGWRREDYHQAAQSYCDHQFQSLIRPKAKECIAAHLTEGHEVLLVSACTEEVLRPFAERLGIKLENVLGTRTAFKDGVLTGVFDGTNCKGPEKVRRLLERLPNRNSYHLDAYGDSSGDKELLAFADSSFYKVFE